MRAIGEGYAAVEINGHRADLFIDRPEKRNAMNRGVLADLTTAFREMRDSDEVRSIALLGRGDVFCAGMDLNMMIEYDERAHAELLRDVHELFDTIAETTVPVVVGIKRSAVAGAFELTLPCDYRIIGEDADYGVPEVKMGVFPSGGTTQRLPRLVGLARAKEIVLTGDFVDPHAAEDMGLVNEVCSDDQVDARTRSVATDFAERSPLGMERALEAFNHAFDDSLDRGLDVERYLVKELFGTVDRDEGFRAWLDSDTPEFEGH